MKKEFYKFLRKFNIECYYSGHAKTIYIDAFHSELFELQLKLLFGKINCKVITMPFLIKFNY